MPPQHESAPTEDRPLDGLGVAKSPLSCHRCRRLKRRCDRQYPFCALCCERQESCDYPPSRKQRNRPRSGHVMRKPSLLSPRTSSRTASTAGSSIQASAVQTASPHPSQYDIHYQLSELSELDIFAASFLNPDDNFIRAQLESAKIEVSITEAVSSLVGSISDIQTIAVEFNQNIYTWMPILSHQQFQETLLERLTLRRAELFLLVLAMKLCVSRPTVARSALYTTVKEFYISVESSGRLSILILQAAVLIAVYELGHGIYPAVLLSVANCARIGVLLGVDNSLTKLAHTTEIPWIKLEECRRVWWMILILDRFVNLSNPKRHLVTSDPDSDSYLPVDDAEWDSGISKPADAVQLRFSSQMNIGRFARFAHAVPLLSQCISRVDEAPHDTVQLRRTILSLINLGEKEGVTKRILFCTLNAACYIPIFMLDSGLLHSNTTRNERSIDNMPDTIYALRHVVATLTQESWSSLARNHERLGPFLMHMLYQALITCLSLRDSPSTEIDIPLTVGVLKSALEQLKTRWLVAGTYLLLTRRYEVFSLVRTA